MMKTIITLLVIFSLFELLPAQGITFSSNENSFQLCAFAATEDGNPIENVNYQLGGYSGDPDFPDIFEGGCVTINDQYITGSLSLNPLKDINHLNGVSTFDLVMIARHILGVQVLPSPYKMIAADINRSGAISIIDLIELRKLIVGVNLTFPSNTSWRFIDSEFVFPNPMNPWATSFPEICIINTTDEDVTKNFIGIKVGDVNGSAAIDTFTVVDDRSDNKLVFQLENQKFEANEEINLDFKATNLNKISGFQFELNFDTEVIELQGFEKGSLENFDENNLGLSNLQNGEIATSWVSLNSDQNETSNEVLFSFKFKTLKKGNLKDLVKITENRLKAEAYSNDLNLLDLNFEFSENKTISNFELFQNQPNPFREETYISFYLNEAQSVKLHIYDVHGNIVKAYRNTFEAGYNQIVIQAADITTTGLYYYQMVTENETLMKKMIKLADW